MRSGENLTTTHTPNHNASPTKQYGFVDPKIKRKQMRQMFESIQKI